MPEGPNAVAPIGRSARSLSGPLAVTAGFVALRFLITPVRIKVVTSVLAPVDYGVVTLVSMTAHGLCLLASVGGFELFLRRLPSLSPSARCGVFRAVSLVSMAGALLASAAMLVFWRGTGWPGGIAATLSAGAAILLFLLFLLFQQRIYYLLGTHEHTRARTLQLLWSDLWFLPLLLLPASVPRSAETAVWTWSAWLLVVLVLTHRWVPSAWKPLQAEDRPSLRAIFLQSVPILPVLVSDWVYRLTGHYALVFYSDTKTMAFYSLAMNLALTAQVAGIPLVDLCCVELGRAAGLAGAGPRTSPSATEAAVFTRAVRHIVAVALPVSLALVFLSDDIVAVLAGPSFRAVAPLLPWAALLPALWLANLLLARVLMLLGKPSCVAFGSIAGAATAVLLCVALVPSHSACGAFAAITIATAVVDAFFAAKMRVWKWVRLGHARWLPMLAGALALSLLYGQSSVVGGGPIVRLVLVAVLTLLILVGTGWIRRQDFRTE